MNISVKRRKLAGSALNYAIATIILLIFASPFVWMTIISTQKEIDILQSPPSLKFDPQTIINNYVDVMFFESGGFIYGVRNSTVVVTASVLGGLLLGIPVAYGLTRFRLRRNRDIAFFILSNRFMPPIVVAFPIFLMIAAIHLQDNYLGVIIPYIGANLPFVVWMMRAFFKEISTEIDDAAMIDGCSRFEALWRVIVPTVLPGLGATAVFCGILTWNELLLALHILSTTQSVTVPVMAAGSMAMERPLAWHVITAEGVFVTLPMLFLSMLVQKHFVKGLTMGAVTGQ